MQAPHRPHRDAPWRRALLVGVALVSAALVLTACGGGKSKADATGLDQAAGLSLPQVPERPTTDIDAARFLEQATFGPTEADIARLKSIGYAAWIDEQLAQPASPTHMALFQQGNAISGGRHQFNHSFWEKALTSPDQLRQRLTFALSQIFVVSSLDNCGASAQPGMISYYDLLERQAFGSYRALLERVTLHPIMGCYLSHLHNQKADLTTGRVPDENYAREILQLFSIGLVQLKQDGTPTRPESPEETYDAADIAALARAFTGFSWDCPERKTQEESCFLYWGATVRPGHPDPWTQQMVAYPNYHDSAPKTFLKQTVRGSTDPMETLRLTLDVIAGHPNVAPFISQQLIQRFVTSNPDPDYVARVAKVFTATGGDLGQTVKAVLLDPKARLPEFTQDPQFGKVREPVLALSGLLRAFDARSDSGRFLILPTHDATHGLNQSPLMAASVFNFYRPGYVPPEHSQQGLKAPELQILNEISLAGGATLLLNTVWHGLGRQGYNDLSPRSDVQLAFHDQPDDPLFALADHPDRLISAIHRRLSFRLSEGTRSDIAQAIASIDYRYAQNPTAEQIADTRRVRLWAALSLAVLSPDYLVQQ